MCVCVCGGGEGCCRFLALYEKWAGGGGGGGAGGYDRVSRSPGYSTVVEFMRTGINRQRNRASIIVKCGPKSY